MTTEKVAMENEKAATETEKEKEKVATEKVVNALVVSNASFLRMTMG